MSRTVWPSDAAPPGRQERIFDITFADRTQTNRSTFTRFLPLRFWLRGASTRAAATEINAALGTRLSHSTISKISNTLEPTLRIWESQPIPTGTGYLFLDALYLPVRRPGFTSEQALLAALGLDAHGTTDTSFFNEPQHLWTILRSTNILERFNRELRRRLNSAGAMHSELEVLKLTCAVSQAQEQRWAKRKLWTKRAVQPMKKAA